MTVNTSYHIFNESGIRVPFDKNTLASVLHRIESHESCRFNYIEVIFIDDEEILKINRNHLNHDYITDIITFPYHEADDALLEGTLYCCAPQIKRQCKNYESSYKIEILRVVIHGLLHLTGYHDDTPDAKKIMHELEDKYITLYLDS